MPPPTTRAGARWTSSRRKPRIRRRAAAQCVGTRAISGMKPTSSRMLDLVASEDRSVIGDDDDRHRRSQRFAQHSEAAGYTSPTERCELAESRYARCRLHSASPILPLTAADAHQCPAAAPSKVAERQYAISVTAAAIADHLLAGPRRSGSRTSKLAARAHAASAGTWTCRYQRAPGDVVTENTSPRVRRVGSARPPRQRCAGAAIEACDVDEVAIRRR